MNSTTNSLLELLDASPWVNVLRCVLSLNAMFSNAFLLFLFCRFQSFRKFQCNWLIVLCAVVECVIGFGMGLRGMFQMYVAANGIQQFSHSLCVLIGSPLTGGFAANQIPILSLAIDRVRAVVYPLKFGSKNTPFLLCSSLLTLFIFSAAIWVSLFRIDNTVLSTQCSMGVNAGPWFSTVWTIYAQTSTLIVFALYIALLVFFCAKTRSLTIDPKPNNQIQQHQQQKPDMVIQQHQMIQQNKLTISIVLILTLYSITWALPTAIWFIFNLLDPSNRTRINYVTFTQGFVTPLGAGLNLYIYLAKHAEIRNCTLKVWPWLKPFLRGKDTEIQFIGVAGRTSQQFQNFGRNRTRDATLSRVE